MQPTLDPLPNQPTRFSHPSSVEAPGPHYLKNARRIRKAGVDAFTAVPMLPPPRCRCLHCGVDALTAVSARGTKIPSHSALKVLSVVGRPSSHGSSSSGVRPLMTAYSRPSTVLLPLPLCRYAVVRGGLAAVRGAPDAVICSNILP
ncbi:hypothetical protein EV122DRAFT_294527 [Schizophyllum commune]